MDTYYAVVRVPIEATTFPNALEAAWEVEADAAGKLVKLELPCGCVVNNDGGLLAGEPLCPKHRSREELERRHALTLVKGGKP